ncbi:LlaJI family restriction endonuclease [Inquilinus sp. KBS0705]|nr:LlaJI family restriction endonuclease [Inquilinus sp. KBS0705]
MQIEENGIAYLFEQVEDYSLEYVKSKLGMLFNPFLQAGFLTVKNDLVKFNYVGIAANARNVICVLPKYMFRKTILEENLINEGRTLIKILKQYDINTSYFGNRMEFYDQSSSSETSEIAIADFLLKDYLSHGIWSYQNKYIAEDDSNEVLWEYTVERSQPVISKYPYYFNVFSQGNETLSNTVISRIHKWGISYVASRYCEILDLEITFDEIESTDIEELGDQEYLIEIINKELRITFNDRDITLLKSLKELLKIGTSTNVQDYTLYGKNKFEHVWEDAVSFNFRNEYREFAGFISKPEWVDSDFGKITEKNTLRPDVIKWIKNDTRSVVLIIDAKYYLFDFNTINQKAENNPGVGDLVKQYFYELVLNRATSNADWLKYKTSYRNILMFPGRNRSAPAMTKIGAVSLENSAIEKPIHNFHLNPYIIFDNYIKQQPLSDSMIETLADL